MAWVRDLQTARRIADDFFDAYREELLKKYSYRIYEDIIRGIDPTAAVAPAAVSWRQSSRPSPRLAPVTTTMEVLSRKSCHPSGLCTVTVSRIG